MDSTISTIWRRIVAIYESKDIDRKRKEISLEKLNL